MGLNGYGQTSWDIFDINNIGSDFENVHYDSASADEIEIKRHKNLAWGAWDPITGY